MSILEGDKRLGGETHGTADPNWPKGYSVPYSIMLGNICGMLGEFGLSKVALAQGVTGHWSAGGRWWGIAFA